MACNREEFMKHLKINLRPNCGITIPHFAEYLVYEVLHGKGVLRQRCLSKEVSEESVTSCVLNVRVASKGRSN